MATSFFTFSPAAVKAAYVWLRRLRRLEHPAGAFDSKKRWYPDDSEVRKCCSKIRPPSRRWPFSLLVHCRTAGHVGNLYGVPERDVRAAASWVARHLGVKGGLPSEWALRRRLSDGSVDLNSLMESAAEAAALSAERAVRRRPKDAVVERLLTVLPAWAELMRARGADELGRRLDELTGRLSRKAAA